MTILPRGIGHPTGKVALDQVTLRFGRLAIAFQPGEPGTRFSIDETHLPFVAEPNVEPALRLRCRIGEIRAPDGTPTFTAGGAWDLHRRPDGGEDMIIRGGPNFSLIAWRLSVDRAYREGSLIEAPVMPDRLVRADGYPLLEYMVARLLGRHDGLLIHASVAIVDEGAYVFVGHSGAGKSTMAAIAEAAGARIPTDDRTIITVDDGGEIAWGTPWHGSLIRKSPEGAPVRAIYLLAQANENRVEALAPARAIKELFVRLIQPRLDQSEVLETFRILETLVQRVPVSFLHFRPTRAAFDLAVGSTKLSVRS